MCLALPMRITAIDGAAATIEAEGLEQRRSLMLVPARRVGDYVLVHAGFAITVLESDDAAERLALFARSRHGGRRRGRVGADPDAGRPHDPSI